MRHLVRAAYVLVALHKALQPRWVTTPDLVSRQRSSYCHPDEVCFRERGQEVPSREEVVPIDSVWPTEDHSRDEVGDPHFDKVSAYQKLFEGGQPMPPAYVVGSAVVDGNRRYEAARRAGVRHIPILRRGGLPK